MGRSSISSIDIVRKHEHEEACKREAVGTRIVSVSVKKREHGRESARSYAATFHVHTHEET